MSTEIASETFMLRCLNLAALGAGYAAPNPMVGAVLVHQNRIIGEGYHQQYGKAHAEVNAVNAVKNSDKHLISQSTLYVSLEPCAHYGKTPPCAELIIEQKIPRVVIATLDPFPEVAGRGVELLRKHGIDVITGVMEEEARWLNRRFIHFHTTQSPWVILKWAQTEDLHFAKQKKSQTWITNSFSKTLVHRWRSEEQAIMVGTQTALTDNPQLNVRNWFGKPPLRLVLDRNLSLPNTLYIFDQSIPTLIFTQKPIPQTKQTNLTYVQLEFGRQLIPDMLSYLHSIQVQSVFIEGGKQLLDSFITQNYWNEARVITGNVWWKEGIAAPKIPAGSQLLSQEIIYDNRLQSWVNGGIG